MIRPLPSSTLFPYTTLFRSYAVPASNAVLTVQLALERKGISYRRVDQLPVLHRIGMRARRFDGCTVPGQDGEDRKSTRLNSSHTVISYAVFCLKKKKCEADE